MFNNIQNAIKQDTRVQNFQKLKKDLVIGQMEMWDSKNFVDNYQEDISQALSSFEINDWFMTAPSISEGKNYLYSESEYVIELLEKTIDAKFVKNFGTTSKLWLRKEIMKAFEEA